MDHCWSCEFMRVKWAGIWRISSPFIQSNIIFTYLIHKMKSVGSVFFVTNKFYSIEFYRNSVLVGLSLHFVDNTVGCKINRDKFSIGNNLEFKVADDSFQLFQWLTLSWIKNNNRLYYCYGNPLCQEGYHYWFTNGWVFVSYCSIM